jgi:hypothetical protein
MPTTMRYRIGLFTALALAGCVPSNVANMAQEDRARFARCMHAIQPVVCAGISDTSGSSSLAMSFCERSAQSTYADLPSTPARKRYLVANGCPPSQVEPERYLTEEEEEPAPAPRPALHAVHQQSTVLAPPTVDDDTAAK